MSAPFALPGTNRVDPPEEPVTTRSPTGEVEAVLTRTLLRLRREYAALLGEARACGAELVAKGRTIATIEGELALMGVTLEQGPATMSPVDEEPDERPGARRGEGV